MTIVNDWIEFDPSVNRRVRAGLVQCDECRRLETFTTPERLRARPRPWRFDDFERGPHVCNLCRRPRSARRRFAPTQAGKEPALPNFLIVGAAKCATTSLSRYLAAHPQIHMSDPKELNFFQDPRCLDQLETYASYFDGEAPVRGEASVSYTYHPCTSGTPERIRATIPQAKLVYVVRDPIDRIISAYAATRRRGESFLSFEQWLGDVANPHNRQLAVSRYATQLEQYLDCFDSSQLLVVDQARLRDRRRETMREVFAFLDVKEDFASQQFGELHNTSDVKRVTSTRVGSSLAASPIADALRRLPAAPREAIFRPARRVLSRRVKRPQPEGELVKSLQTEFHDDVRRLRELTGQLFATWSV